MIVTTRRFTLLITILLFNCGLPPLQPQAAAPEEPLALAEQKAFRQAVARVAGSLVRIEPTGISTARLRRAAEATPATGPSSGLVVAEDGWVLTTAFAVPDDVNEVVITLPPNPAGPEPREQLPPRRLVGRVTGRDSNRGLVLLKCEPDRPLPVPEWAEAASLRAGQWAIASGRVWDIANPSMAVGIVSAVDRAWGRALQTDAAISPANYGGPLLDIHGRVMGLITPLPADTAGMNLGTELYDSGIGFAVPMADLLPLLPRLQEGATLQAGLLGIGYAAEDPINGPPLITTVHAESPAARAGLRSGDRILSIDGRSVRRIADARHALTPRQAGDTVEVVIRRGPEDTPEDVTVRATLVEQLPPWRRTMLGLIPVRQAATKDRRAKPSPLEVGWVWPDSPADRAGIEPGDIITAAATVPEDGSPATLQPIASGGELAGLLGGLAADTKVVLQRQRADDQQQIRLAVVPLPPIPPVAVPDTEATAATVVKLEAPDLAEPGWALLPTVPEEEPLGTLVFFPEPTGPLSKQDADTLLASWQAAVGRYRVAVVVLGSSEQTRWSRSDLDRVGRSLDALAGRRRLDPTRIAFAGRGAGGSFAWLAADRFANVVRGVGMLDAVLPRRVTIQPASPAAFRWVLLGESAENTMTGTAKEQASFDREQLMQAGLPVGEISPGTDADRAAFWCRWVETLGVL